MITIRIILLIFANILVTSVDGRAKMKKYLWLQELKPCFEDPQMAAINGSFKYTGQGSFYLNVDVFTPRKIDKLFFFVEMKKCPTKLYTEDCEQMMAFPAGDQCDIADAYFRHLYSQFQPPIACPLSGKYLARNVILEPEQYSIFFRGLGDDEWLHAYIDAYSDIKKENREICVLIIAAIRKIRVRDNGNRNKTQS